MVTKSCGIDRELYLPRGWAEGPDRRRAAGVPDTVEFATKLQLVSRMVTRALQAGVPAGWVAADEVYGASTALRRELETQQLGYVLAVACNHRVHTSAGTAQADELVARLPKRAWQRVSAGAGAHGQRYDDWGMGPFLPQRVSSRRAVLLPLSRAPSMKPAQPVA